MDPADVLAGIPRFRAFQESLSSALADLPIDSASPLTVVPSGRMAGIPIHAALPGYDLAYCPSLAVAVALAHRGAALSRQPEAIGEVRCWCHGEEVPLIDALCEGGEALRTICAERGAVYQVASDTAATRDAVAALVDASTWVKLSCHGVDKPSFALILSDGEHTPPSLIEVLERPETGARYLFDWNELSGIRSRCRAVLSSACTSGSVGATRGGEQTGLARAFLMSGVLAFVAPLWPVAGGPGQTFVNKLMERCLAEPGMPLATQLARTRAALQDALPPRIADAFVLHGHAGPINPITMEGS
jgi:CHAT domain-containing protein